MKLEDLASSKIPEIQSFLSAYQQMSGEIINLSEFQYEHVSRKCKELELYCSDLERKIEVLIIKNQTILTK